MRATKRVLRQKLPEQDDVRLQRLKAARAFRRRFRMSFQLLDDFFECEAAATNEAYGMRDRPVHLDQLVAAGDAVQPVDVLRDDGLDQATSLELADDLVRAVW